MKKFYTLIISLFFITSLAFAQNAQCNGGGCYNLNLQNPSGTFNTTSNGWSLVANCMTGGNYAVFDVACGGEYEWTTCSDFGGMQAWDAEITLLDASNNILCYQDNSGRPGCSSSPYLGWTATFTGQVKILLTETGCITNGSGCNRLVWRMSQAGGAPSTPVVNAQPDPANPTAGIKLTWSAVSGASTYSVYDCSDNSLVTQVSVPEATITGLQSGLNYSYKVKACGGASCCSAYSSCASTSTQAAAAPPVANFSSSITSVVEGNSVDFADLSTNSPSTWGWTFQGGVPSTSNLQDPNVVYNTAGLYSVSLTVSNSYGSDTKTQASYINVLQQGSTSLYVGGLVIYADNITPTGNMRTATGNVRIGLPTCNSFIHFEDDLYIEMGTSEITANTEVLFINNLSDTTKLYNGPFTYKITGATLTDINNPINGVLRLAKLPVQIYNLELLCDGILIEGYLSLPADISKWTSNPAFGSTTVNATLNGLKITQSQGIQFNASLNVKNIKVANKLKLDYLNISLNTIDDVFTGSCKLTTPIIGIGGSARISQGKLDQIGLSVSPLTPIPLGTTGLAISTGYGSVQYLSTPPPLEITLGAHIVPATPYSFEALGYLDISAFYQLGTCFGATGKISIFNHYLAQTGFKVWSNKFNVWGKVGFKKFIEGFASFSVTKPPTDPIKFSGIFGASLKMPPKKMVDSMPAYLRYPLTYLFPYDHVIATCQNYVNTSYLTGFAELNAMALGFSIPKMYYKLQWAGSNGFSMSYGINYQTMPAEARYALGINRASSTILIKDFTVANSTKSLIIETFGENNVAQTKLYLPNGDSVEPATVTQFPGVTYFSSNDLGLSGENYSCYHLENPTMGDYSIAAMNSNDSIKILRANVPPFIEMETSSIDDNAKELSLNWVDSDPDDNASISIGLDNDPQGGDGITIYEGVEENDVADVLTVDYSDLPTGTYYAYAEIIDDAGQLDLSYSDEKLTLITANAPVAPINLSYNTTDTSIIFNFSKGANLPMDYILYFSNEQGELDYSSFNISFGDTSTYEFVNFKPGLYYEFALTAMDSFNRESAMSNVVSFTFTSTTLNNTPYILDQIFDESGKVGDSYTYQLQANDYDNDPLTYSITDGPVGMSIDVNGMISWTPVDTQAGYNQVYVLVSDPSGDIDSIHYNIFVTDSIIGIANIEFNKVLFQNYGDEGIIQVTDPDFETDINIRDSIVLTLTSSSDPIGIDVVAYETELTSRVFSASFKLSNTTSGGDELKASYGDHINASFNDTYPSKTITDFAYFEEFVAEFEMNNTTLCSGETLSLTDKSFGDNIQYSWNFGDGTNSTEQNPEKVYFVSSSFSTDYQVELTITDGEGRSSVFESTVTVFGNNSIECDAKSTFSITAFPTPTDGDLSIKFNASEGEKVGLQLINALGEIIIDLDAITLDSSTSYTIDMGGIAKGVYTVKSTYNGITVSKNIIRN